MRPIDADALKEIIENSYEITWNHDYNGGFKDACVSILDEIDSAPTIEPEHTVHWIPCSERLPSEDGIYLVTSYEFRRYGINTYWWANNLRDVDKYDFLEKKSGWYAYDSEYGHYEVTDVVAWAPLPEPWKGEQNENS